MEDLLKSKDWRVVNESWGTLYHQDCRFILPSLPSDTYDSMVTDPPAGIEFMGKDWDNPDKYGDLPITQERHLQQRQGFISFIESIMKECFRVLKPGAHGVVWALPRTSHWTATALENVGFEIRDCIYHIKPRSPEIKSFLASLTLEQWELLERCKPTDEFLLHIFGSGFPKSHDISKTLDKMAGAVREAVGESPYNNRRPNPPDNGFQQGGHKHTVTSPATDEAKLWAGWGTALKPAVEVWWIARKPLAESSIAAQVRKTGTGAINIDGCRVAGVAEKPGGKIRSYRRTEATTSVGLRENEVNTDMVDAPDPHPGGRWPSHLLITHAPGCQRVGTKDVKGSHPCAPGGGQTLKAYAVQDVVYSGGFRDKPVTDHTNSDGTETIEDWDCAPECPSNMLNEQSGVTTSGAMKTEVPAYEGESNTGFLRGRSGPSNQHGDSGGASRFFQTFEHDPETWECAPDCPSKILNDQSGELKSGEVKPHHTRNSSSQPSKGGYSGGFGDAPLMGYGDSGGASRFFQTFEPEPEKWECVPECPSKILDEQSGERPSTLTGRADPNESHAHPASARPDAFFGTIQGGIGQVYADSGGASRFFKSIEHEPPFFYAAKASRSERDEGLGSRQAKAMHGLKEAKISTQSNRKCRLCGRVKFGQPHCECPAPEWEETSGSMSKNSHPTVKSIKLMTYLVRLVTPKGGTVLDPFSGSGSTLVAAIKEGARFVGIEREEEYALIAEERVRYTAAQELEMQEALATFDLLSELEQEF